MKSEDAARRFAELYRQTYDRFYRRIRHQAYRPSRESLAVLRHMAAVGPMTVTEAAEHFDRSQSAMSEILERLVGRGMLKRMVDDRDRRRTLIWLTPEARQVLEDSEQVLSVRLLEHGLAQMKASERSELIDRMQALLETIPCKKGWEENE